MAGEHDQPRALGKRHVLVEIAGKTGQHHGLEPRRPFLRPEGQRQSRLRAQVSLLVGIEPPLAHRVRLEALDQMRRGPGGHAHHRGIAGIARAPVTNDGEFSGLMVEEDVEAADHDDVEIEKQEIALKANVLRPQRQLAPRAAPEPRRRQSNRGDFARLYAGIEAGGIVGERDEARRARHVAHDAAIEPVHVIYGEAVAPPNADDRLHGAAFRGRRRAAQDCRARG